MLAYLIGLETRILTQFRLAPADGITIGDLVEGSKEVRY
jgi:hypothetical protein